MLRLNSSNVPFFYTVFLYVTLAKYERLYYFDVAILVSSVIIIHNTVLLNVIE